MEAFSSMQQDLHKEKKAITKQWAKREEQIDRVMQATVGMYGDFQGIAGKTLQIYYRSDEVYVPDFVVETKTDKYLCEIKRADQMQQDDVLAKAKAAVVWCQHAAAHEKAYGGKSWSYLLIPHDAITENKTLQALATTFSLVA